MRGNVMFMDFGATWCEPWVRILPSLDGLQRRFPDELLVVSVTRLYGAISQAAALEQINKFMDKHEVRHPVLVADKETNITNHRVQTFGRTLRASGLLIPEVVSIR